MLNPYKLNSTSRLIDHYGELRLCESLAVFYFHLPNEPFL